MTTGIGALSVEITGDAAGFTAALKNAEGQLRSTQAKMNTTLANLEGVFGRMSRNLVNLVGPANIARAALASIAGGISLAGIRSVIDSVGGIGELAEQLGVSTDALQAYQYAASQAGLSQEQLNAALAKYTRTIGEAAEGNKGAIDAFEALGVKILDASGKTRDSEAILGDIANALLAIEDPTVRAARAAGVFGDKLAQKLLPMLSGGAVGLQRFRDEADRLGLIISGDKIKSADNLSDKISQVERSIVKLYQSLVSELFDGFNELNAFLNGDKLTGSSHLTEVLKSTQKEIDALKRTIKDGGWFDATQLFKNLGPSELDAAIAKVEAMERALANAAKRGQDLMLRPAFKAELEAAREAVQKLQAQMAQSSFEADENFARRDKLPPVTAPGVRNPTPSSTSQTRATAQRELEEFIEGTRRSAEMAGMETLARQKLEAVLRAEALARRAGRELTAAERVEIEGNIALEDWRQRQMETRNTLQQRAAELYESTRTPAEQYADTIARINEIVAAYPELEEAGNRARTKAAETFEQASSGAATSKQFIDQFGASMNSAFENAVIGGGKLSDIFEGLIQDIIRMTIRLLIMKPLLDSIGSFFGGSGPGPSTSPAGIAGAAGLAGFGLPGAANGATWRVGGAGGTDSQLVAFRASPGEMVDVSTPGQAAGRGGGNVIVNVTNKTDGKASAREEQGPNMERIISVTVEKELRRPGSSMNRAMRDTFTVGHRLTKRG